MVKTFEKLSASVKNPYRPGSKKAQAFELFRQGGEREAIVAKISRLGATPLTAATWVNLFRKLG